MDKDFSHFSKVKTLKNLSHQVLLIILDGFGISQKDNKNAIKNAHTPHFDALFEQYPLMFLEAGGRSVGLPPGIVGNSEVGHMNIGAGRSVRQDLVRINEAVRENTLKDRPEFKALLKTSNTVHLLGLLSDGGVHSHLDHIIHIVKLLLAEKKDVYLHAFMDGRDTSRDSGIRYLEKIENIKGLTVASIQGRSLGMDRDQRWDKICKSYEMLIGRGITTSVSPREWIEKEYSQERFDEFITPALFSKDYAIKRQDAIFFVNFRPDRASQLTLAFNDPQFKEFKRDFIPKYFLCMSPYVPDEINLPILFNKEKISGGLSEYLCRLGHRQFKIAETEKYAHVTYFFNGGCKYPHDGEEFLLIPSPKDCKTYDEKPQMSAFEVCDKLLEALDKDYTFYLVNFANADMVGHTGNYEAALKAVEVLDECVGKLMNKCKQRQTAMFLTADHGNCDQMAYEDGRPHTSHTGAPVPFCLFHPSVKDKSMEKSGHNFSLQDIAPTVLHCLGIESPKNFEGVSIFR